MNKEGDPRNGKFESRDEGGRAKTKRGRRVWSGRKNNDNNKDKPCLQGERWGEKIPPPPPNCTVEWPLSSGTQMPKVIHIGADHAGRTAHAGARTRRARWEYSSPPRKESWITGNQLGSAGWSPLSCGLHVRGFLPGRMTLPFE